MKVTGQEPTHKHSVQLEFVKDATILVSKGIDFIEGKEVDFLV